MSASYPRLRVHLEGIGLYGPGFMGWAASAPILSGAQPYAGGDTVLPAPEALPPAERRRVGLALKLSMAVGFDAVRQAGRDPASLPAVFSSTGSDCDNCHQILTTLASDDRAVSPTRFHNSVHNMPAGYWSIATGCMAPSTSLCAYDATFSAALLEAATQAVCLGTPCLLVAFDTAYPEPLFSLRPIPHALGVGLVIQPERTERTIATLELQLLDEAPTVLPDGGLETLRRSVPAGRCLPLLKTLAMGESGRVVIEHLDGLSLVVDVLP